MHRYLLPCVVLFVMLAVAPAANAQITTLYNTIDGPQTVQGINSVAVGPSFLGEFRAATSFVPTRSGNATVVSMRGQCVIPYPQGTTCQGIGEVSIQANVNGRPSGVSLGTMGFYLTDSLSSGNPVKKECGRLSPGVQLTAGTKYWAVMTAPDGIGWLNWTDDSSEVLESIDGGAWQAALNRKRLALRIDGGVDECVPDAKILPEAGTTLGDLYVRTGGTAVNSITVENIGLAPLTWSGYSVSGADAQYFSVVPQPGQPFRFPRQIGVGGLTLGYIACVGGTEERWYRATVTLHTNDPDTPNRTIPVECLVDNTGPTVDYERPQPDGRNGWFIKPIPVNAWAIDPEPSSLVRQLTCVRGDQRWDSPGAALSATLATEGAAGLGCWASDRVGNGGSSSWHEFKLDTRKPVVEPTFNPQRTEDGWNNTATSVSFGCDDPTPGSGVETSASGGGSVNTETAGTDFTSGGCTDVAGHVSTPFTATIRIDMTEPVISVAGVTPAANAAGWHRTDPTIAWSCADTGFVQSGIRTDTVADTVVTQETSGTNVSSAGTCADRAANHANHITRRIQLDKTAPTTAIGGGPATVVNVTDAELTFSGADARSGVAGYECRLDGGAYAACASPYRLSGLPDGAHTLEVRTVDIAGNPDASPAAHTWTVDTVEPETAIATGPAAATSARTAAFTYSGDPLGGTAIARIECRLDGGAWGACTDYSGLTDGEHRFEARAVDAAGNADGTPAARTWTVDTAAPQTSVDTGPAAATGSRSAAFTYSGDALGGTAIAGYECRLDGGAWGPCAAYTGLADGDHRFEVRARDAAGNADDSPAVRTWTVDTAGPDTEVTRAPGAASAQRTAEFEYRGMTLGGTDVARFECRIDGGAWSACAAYTGLADGDHRFEVRAIDAAGNPDATPAAHAWTVDTVGPQTAIGSAPDAVTASQMAAFTYSGDAGGGTAIAGYECRLDDDAWGACQDYANLDAGEHRFHVRAIDAAGNADETPATHTWAIDLTAPATTLTAKPDAVTPQRTARFTLDATDAGGSTVAGFECRLDAAPFAPCDSPVTFDNLQEGDHTFEVRAADRLGNVESPAVSYTWTVAAFFALDDEATTPQDTPVRIDLAANDVRPGPMTVAADTESAEGGEITDLGDGAVRYAPPAGFSGSDTFGYVATHNGDTSAATVTVTVTPAPAGDPASPPATVVAHGPSNAAPRVMVARDGRCGRSQSGTFRLVIADDDGSKVQVTGTASSRLVGLEVGGSGTERTVSISRRPGLRRATVTLRVTDGPHELEVPIGIAVGTAAADRIRGTAGMDLLFGSGGRDVIAGRGGDDLLCGGTGSDRLDGGAGDDVLIAGRGNDVLRGADGHDVLRGDTGADRLVGGAGDDVLRGGPRADVFDGAPGNDRLVDFNPRRGDVR
ncbi:MAG TPA: Ig-like domain-containing protein [Solirubrobacteraceae bacterium]|nr:Ig-like domain-containing protein [Solirubrobacteraceae bacterium]